MKVLVADDVGAAADTRFLVSAISRRDGLFPPRTVASLLPCAMPFYHRVYSPGELQFITTTLSPYPLFLSERFRRCFVQRLEEVRRELHFLLIGWVLMPEYFHVLRTTSE